MLFFKLLITWNKLYFMLLASNLLTLEYNPTTDVLFIVWPDIHGYSLDEVKETMAEILRNIRRYDVKRLLVDSRRTVVRINNEMYASLTADFGKELLKTSLKRAARLESGHSAREKQVQEMVITNKTAIEFESFPDKKTALEWLLT